MKDLTEKDHQRLVEIIRDFVEDNGITCNETIWQTDWVSENALPLISQLVEIVGYKKSEDDDSENDDESI